MPAGERLNYFIMLDIIRRKTMAKRESSSGGGLMSSAGLMRYFEAEEATIKIDPKTVVIAAVAIGAFILILDNAHKLKFF